MSDSVRPHRWPPTRLLCPWDSPGKNTGVGCHFLFQCMKVKSESEVALSCPTLSDLMDCSLPGSSVHGIFQARVLEWGAIAFFGRGPLKEIKSKQAAPASVRNETLCPATVSITRSPESVCMGRTWGLELGLCHWNDSGTIGSSLTSSKEPWSGVPGPP